MRMGLAAIEVATACRRITVATCPPATSASVANLPRHSVIRDDRRQHRGSTGAVGDKPYFCDDPIQPAAPRPPIGTPAISIRKGESCRP